MGRPDKVGTALRRRGRAAPAQPTSSTISTRSSTSTAPAALGAPRRAGLLPTSPPPTSPRAAIHSDRRAEVFDPQTHRPRRPLRDVHHGDQPCPPRTGRPNGGSRHGLILCFLRHLSQEAALDTLEEARPFAHLLTAVGLDSAEVGGTPPSKDSPTPFRRAREMAPAGGRARRGGDPAGVRSGEAALDAPAGPGRIDHGVRCLEDDGLVDRLVAEQVPAHRLPAVQREAPRVPLPAWAPTAAALVRRGLHVTVNFGRSAPGFFGGCIARQLYWRGRRRVRLRSRSRNRPAGPELLPGRLPGRRREEAVPRRGRSRERLRPRAPGRARGRCVKNEAARHRRSSSVPPGHRTATSWTSRGRSWNNGTRSSQPSPRGRTSR